MDEASNTNSEENDESSTDKKTKVSNVWISRQLVNHWFLNTVSSIFVRLACPFISIHIHDTELYLYVHILICILANDIAVRIHKESNVDVQATR